MLLGEFLAIIKTAGGEMVYVDYCRGEIDNLPKKKYGKQNALSFDKEYSS